MGEVLEAVARGASGFERRVAIKRLLRGAELDPAASRMFLDEARIASRLHHAGIVAVLDYGLDGTTPFQVLELVDGFDVAALIRRSAGAIPAVPDDIALYIAAEVAHALAFAHEARDERGVPLGIVHRDVKPSNVLVSRAGDVKLGDFGIAFARERASRTTGVVAKGTPAYMAPEQLLGGAVDGRADVFALGCMLHAMIAGRSPRAGLAPADLVSSSDVVLAPVVAGDIREIVARAVRHAPSERWPSARALAGALGDALARRLRTDAKTRITEWLGTAPALGAATRTEISPPLHTPDLPAPQRAPAPVVAPTAAAPTPPARGAAPRRRHGVVFALALLAPLAIAAVAIAGIVVGARLATGGADGRRAPIGSASAPPLVDTTADASDGNADGATDVAPSTPMASTSASAARAAAAPPRLPPGFEPRCECVARHSGNFVVKLCTPPMPPTNCECWLDLRELCRQPNARMSDACDRSYANETPGARCEGYERVSTVRVEGTVTCERCYGAGSAPAPAVHGAECTGVTRFGDSLHGVWRCHP